MPINPVEILKKYAPSQEALKIVLTHSQAVTNKALEIAQRFPQVDGDFIYEAGLLHDIGVFWVKAPKIECFGTEPYIKHGILGGEVLRKEGLPRHAGVAENHTGVGVTVQDIIEGGLPLPQKDFVPQTLEEKIISYADLFFSKSDRGKLQQEESVEEVRTDLAKYGIEKIEIFEQWRKELEQN